MTRQTRIAFVAALCFVLMAVVLALAPVNFVTWTPGRAYDVLAEGDEPAIGLTGVQTYPTEGQLDITTVSVTSPGSRLTLPEAVLSYWLPSRDVLPRESVYPAGKSASQVESEEQAMMTTSQTKAVVAGLRAGDVEVVERPVISAVTVGGPSEGALAPGDLVLTVQGLEVTTKEEVVEELEQVAVGDEVEFTVLRGGAEQQVVVTTRGSNAENPASPVIGVKLDVGYDYGPQVSFGIDPAIGGSSAGLVFSLAIYDKITPGTLVHGQIAGTGTIEADGEVGAIGGIRQKIRGAEDAGATTFLVPEPNCGDLAGLQTDLDLVAVPTLDSAISSVEQLADPATVDDVPRCS